MPVLNSTTIMELDVVPEHLIVLGGGYIGLEFGQMFRRFGSRVTIVQRGQRLLAREDADIADAVAEILREDGIEVLLDTDARRASRGADGAIELTVAAARRTASALSPARTCWSPPAARPNTDSAEPGRGGDRRPTSHGFIRVDERLATNVPGIYALGDIKGGPAFTHISYDDFRIIRTNLIDGGSATTADRLVPYTVFIDPQLGRVGHERGGGARSRGARSAWRRCR